MLTTPVVGIMLAAGASRRMGRPKQLLPYGNGTLAEHVARQLMDSPLDAAIAVLPPNLPDLATRLRQIGLQTVTTPRQTDSPAASLQAALAITPANAAVVICLGDQPELTPAIVARLVTARRAGGLPAAQATYDGQPGHPLLLSGPALAAVQHATGPRPVWRWLQDHPDETLQVDMHRPPLADLNTPADFERIAANWQRPH